ncbi:transcription antitermination factor NusB [Halalkalibacillus halophilus]|uniref:transcription antitermination factor NusB n=1 Tax=Halalkalibacillus halophilus TaxID=392827 RepID=UPI000423346A|nr:transcription antitermination factor NusB [Halalkalibacillus halophilus]
MKRSHSREKAFQVLYQIDINESQSTEELVIAMDEELDPFSRILIDGVIAHKSELDKKISDKLEKWSFNRIGTVEKTVLRIAVFEIFHQDDTPNKVVVNEAIDLSKRFNDEQSGKFINGVLSKFF